jgi:hypothetical protein
MRHTTLWLMVWGVLSAVSALAQDDAGGLADDADASRYLSTFKQRALDAALESGARVKGVAYIDDQGRLHERAMFSTEADVKGIQVESYLEAMGGEEALDAIQVSDGARCQLWTGSGAESGLVAIKIAGSSSREASERALQQKQEALLVEALDRALTSQGYRVLAPVGPKPKSYQNTTYARALVGDWSEGPAPDFGVTVSVRMLADDREENDFYVNHPGLASIVYVLSSTAKPVKFAITLSFEQPAARRPMGDFRALVETGAYRAFESGEWVMEQDEDDLKEWVSAAAAEFTESTDCLPRVFKVTRDGPQRFSIDAGRARGVTEGAWLLVGDRQLMVNNVVSDMTLDTLVMLRVLRADDYKAQAEPLPSGEGALVSKGELLGTLP